MAIVRRFFVLPDMHLGGRFRVKDTRLSKQWWQSADAVRIMIKEKLSRGEEISGVISAGDFFDEARASAEELAVASGLIQLAPFYFINGTHDKGDIGIPSLFGGIRLESEKECWLSAPAGAGHPGLALVGIEGHANVGERMRALTLTQPTILVVHAQYAGCVEINAEYSHEDIPENVVCVLSGHIHQPIDFGQTEGARVLSLGSAFPLSFSESPSPCLWDVVVRAEDDGKASVAVSSYPLPAYPMNTSYIRSEEELQSVRAYLGAQEAFNLLRVRVSPDMLDSVTQLQADYLDAHLIEWILEGELEDEEEGTASSLEGMLTIDELIEDSVDDSGTREYLKRLVAARSPSQFVRTHREQAVITGEDG